jgi:hypothetical protein
MDDSILIFVGVSKDSAKRYGNIDTSQIAVAGQSCGGINVVCFLISTSNVNGSLTLVVWRKFGS